MCGGVVIKPLLKMIEPYTLNKKSKTNTSWLFFTCLYIFFDYSRIHDTFNLGAMRPLMIVTLVLICFLIVSGDYSYSKSKQTTLIWLFFFLLSSYIFFARNNYYAYTTAKSHFLLIPFISSMIICLDTIERLKKFINYLICLYIYMAIFGITHGGAGPGNYFTDENDLCLYINMWIPFCYFLFFYEKRNKYKVFYASGLIIGLLSVTATFSRGGLVGLLSIFFSIIAFSKRKIFALAILILITLFFFVFTEDAYWDDMSTITNLEDSTTNERLLSWGASWRMFIDNPFGVGGNNFQVQFPLYQSDEHTRVMWGRVAHSLWFTLLPEVGILGVLIYFSLLFFNIKDIIYFIKNGEICINRTEEKYFEFIGRAFLCSLVGYFASATFISVLYYSHYWYMTGLIVATKKLMQDNLELS